jgi:hypothetical protein
LTDISKFYPSLQAFVSKAKEGGYVRIHVNDLERDFVEQNNAVVTPLQFMYPAG